MDSRTVAFEIDDVVYYEDDIAQLLSSNKAKDKQTLNCIVTKAVEEDFLLPLRYLVQHGYKIQAIGDSKKTFLHKALYQPSYEILTEGIKYWIPHITEDVVNIVDSNGLTVLHVACFGSDCENLIEKCLDCNADVNAIFHFDSDYTQRDGFQPIHFAAINFSDATYMKILLEHNANVNAKDSRGRTPLHLACSLYENTYEQPLEFFTDKVEFLLNNNADINSRDNLGNTPLLSLFPEDYNVFTVGYEIDDTPVYETIVKLRLLLDKGADVTLSNKQGDTIFHLIIKNLKYSRFLDVEFPYKFNDNDNLQIIQQVLNFCPNFNINVKNIRGETPLRLAIHYLSIDIVKFLLNRDSKILDQDFELLMSQSTYNSVPRMVDIINFFDVLELLVKEGFQINSKGNLDIIAYLVHYNCDGCILPKSYKLSHVSMNLLNLFHYGTFSHFEHEYDKLMNLLPKTFFNKDKETLADLVMTDLKYMEYAGFYINSKLSMKLNQNEKLKVPLSQDKLDQVESELDRMKSAKLTENVTLYDIMFLNPHKIYQYLKDVNIKYYFHGYSLYGNIIKGHLAKANVRNYVVRNAYDYLLNLLLPFCPILCCKMIIDLLSNEDILNVCKAIAAE